MIALDPHTIGESLADVRTIAQATGRRDEGIALIARAAGRIDRVRLAVRGARRRSVVALEWLDPVFVAGHWTPQLIEYAGGIDLLGSPGEASVEVDWETVAAAEPEVVVVMPCGYDAPRALAEAREHADRLAALARDARSSPSTPPPTSRGRARAWSTASSCSRTSCIRAGCRRRRASRSSCSALDGELRVVGEEIAARDRRDDDRAAHRPADRLRAHPVALLEAERREPAADQAADVRADRDAREAHA